MAFALSRFLRTCFEWVEFREFLRGRRGPTSVGQTSQEQTGLWDTAELRLRRRPVRWRRRHQLSHGKGVTAGRPVGGDGGSGSGIVLVGDRNLIRCEYAGKIFRPGLKKRRRSVNTKIGPKT